MFLKVIKACAEACVVARFAHWLSMRLSMMLKTGVGVVCISHNTVNKACAEARC